MTSPVIACSALPLSPDGAPSRPNSDRSYRIVAAAAAIATLLTALCL